MSSEYFSNYLAEIGNYPLLSAQRELELCEIIRSGLIPGATASEALASAESQSELARHNLRLVVSVAKKYREGILTLEEMTFAGNIGLMEATKRFKGSSLEVRFSTYAHYWIQQSILEALWRGRLIRTPILHAGVLKCIREARSFNEDEVPQDIEKLHSETGVPTRRIRGVLIHQCTVESLDRCVLDESDGDIESALPSDSKTPAMIMGDQDDLSNLADALKTLTHRERVMVFHRFAMNNHEFKQLHQLAADFGVSGERVRQIVILALSKLRTNFEMAIGKDRP